LSVLMTKLIFIFSLTTTSFSGFLEMFEPLRRRHLTWFFPPYHGVFTLWSFQLLLLLFWLIT
jgi:hypothetical protein